MKFTWVFWLIVLFASTIISPFQAFASDQTPFIDCRTVADEKEPVKGPLSPYGTLGLGRWAKFVCSESGQSLVQQDGWYWKFPTVPFPVSFPATGFEESNNEAVYFRRISTTLLQDAERASLHEHHPRWRSLMKEDAPIVRVTIDSTNGISQTIYFFGPNEQMFWATICCEDEAPPFMVINAEKMLKKKLTFESMIVGMAGNSKAKNNPSLQLITAAHEGDLESVKKLIQSGVPVDASVRSGYTSLHYAAEAGHRDIVEFLIKNGANVEAESTLKTTPLNSAVFPGHYDIVVLLLDQGASINKNAINRARNKGHLRVFQEFVRRGYIPTASDLGAAAITADPEMVRYLIGYGIPVDADQGRGTTPLYRLASISGAPVERQVEALELLLSLGASPHVKDEAGDTAVKLTARRQAYDLTEILIAAGADPDIKGSRDESALDVAIRLDDVRLIEILKGNGG